MGVTCVVTHSHHSQAVRSLQMWGQEPVSDRKNRGEGSSSQEAWILRGGLDGYKWEAGLGTEVSTLEARETHPKSHSFLKVTSM